ncbi:type I polyketide synthase [Cellulomonas xiejunii]|uniref:type I polyketide synthase n=1 Tax=Cellulomonas xiejunii TaxID=2968083 RepID=UPI001D0DCC64|nr:type I polyketide synthase [Cellulomonas xiejunii]MCC2314660.1 acyltransferase domain-containing protein [Cellulomonas xiejunii]
MERSESQVEGPRPRDVAVIGVGLRFPGGIENLDHLWSALVTGRDLVTEVPASRWDLAGLHSPEGGPGRTYSRHGAFLDDVEYFDADFFGVPALEAAAMDPAQRLLLEVTWRALEDAGVRPDTLAGTRTGVFTGALSNDYLVRQTRERGLAAIDAYYASGNEFSFGPGRIASYLDLHGPVLNVTTACSSGLVALDAAVCALRDGRCDRALVAAANVLLDPHNTVYMSQVGAMSRTGACRPFSADADGIVRGEGAVALLLVRSDQAPTGRVHGIIRGTAVGHGGRAAGLTMPSVAGQVRVIGAALADAGMHPDEVDYVEAHGTGTPLGDPTELTALGTAVAGDRRRPETPLPVGSVKGNLGHTDAVSGLAGLAKALLVLKHGVVPPTVHADRPTDRIDWESARVHVPARLVPLRRGAARTVVGVSSFGLSGVNCHVLVTDAPDGGDAPPAVRTVQAHAVSGTAAEVVRGTGRAAVLTVSAHDAATLRPYAESVAALVATLRDEAEVADVARRLAEERPTFPVHRWAVPVGSPRETARRLNELPTADTFLTAAPSPSLVLVFSGQGRQHPGMGARFASSSSFLRTVRRVGEIFADHGVDGVDQYVLEGDEPEPGRSALLPQPSVLALQAGLLAVVGDLVPRYDAVLGHSMGEYAAALAGGVLNEEEAVRLVAHRARAMKALRGTGAMIAVRGPAERVAAVVEQFTGACWAAVRNSPTDVVLSVRREVLDRVVDALRGAGLGAAMVNPELALHCPLVNDAADRFAAAIGQVLHHPASVSTPSSVEGESVIGGSAAYWAANFRRPVDLPRALSGLPAAAVLVELGTSGELRQHLRSRDARHTWTALAPAGQRAVGDGPAHLAADLFTAGIDLLPATGNGGGRATSSRLPMYPRRGRRLWYSTSQRPQDEVAPPHDHATSSPLHVPDAAVPDAAVPAVPDTTDGRTNGPSASWVEDVVREAIGEAIGPRATAPGAAGTGFVELGLDSVGAVALAARLRSGGVEADVTDLYDHPTPNALAAALSHRTTRVDLRDVRTPRSGAVGAREQVETVTAAVTGPDYAPEVGVADSPSVVITGMSCRLPGAAGIAEYWDLLLAGAARFGPPPAGRFDDGRAWSGAYIDDPYAFDAGHFEITPAEAAGIDPQHRLLLMLAVEALDDAGLDPAAVAGRLGVFVGADSHDYSDIAVREPGEAPMDYGNRASLAGASGRISYHLGATGPSMTVDTACSSSLVALHAALAALRNGECDHALVGGVNLVLAPTIHQSTARAGALSRSGVCLPFAEDADGYVRGEGAGMLLLSTVRAGENASGYATVLGSAVGHDGRSSGYTAPNGTEQTRLLQRAWQDAGVAPEAVRVVEAHGTGTPLGDPIEVRALARALGPRSEPCLIGSVKSNIGHLEAAAGVAGLIKAALIVWSGRVPRSLGTQRPTPQVPWHEIPVALATEVRELEGPVVVGVSAFGFTGTNAHAVVGPVARAGGPGGSASPVPPVVAVALSAPDEPRRAVAAQDLLRRVPTHEAGLVDLGQRSTCRAHATSRAVVLAEDVVTLTEGLELLADDGNRRKRSLRVARGDAVRDPRPVLVFSGHGSQWDGMGAAFHREVPEFADLVARIDEILEPISPIRLVRRFTETGLPARDDELQMAIFAIQVGLTQMVRDRFETEPAVLGHSMGETAALHAAGLLDLEQAVTMAWRRTEVLRAIVGRGGMTVTGMSPDGAPDVLADFPELDLAVVNTHRLSVVSGPIEELERLERQLRTKRVFAQRLAADGPGHGRVARMAADTLVDTLDDTMLGGSLGLRYYSPVLGREAHDADVRSSAYWAANIGQVVRFDRATEAALADGYNLFVELAPSPVLEAPLRQTVAKGRRAARAVGLVREGADGAAALRVGLAGLWCAGLGGRMLDGLSGTASTRQVLLPPRRWSSAPLGAPEPGAAATRAVVATAPEVPQVPDDARGWAAVWAAMCVTALDAAARATADGGPVRLAEVVARCDDATVAARDLRTQVEDPLGAAHVRVVGDGDRSRFAAAARAWPVQHADLRGGTPVVVRSGATETAGRQHLLTQVLQELGETLGEPVVLLVDEVYVAPGLVTARELRMTGAHEGEDAQRRHATVVDQDGTVLLRVTGARVTAAPQVRDGRRIAHPTRALVPSWHRQGTAQESATPRSTVVVALDDAALSVAAREVAAARVVDAVQSGDGLRREVHRALQESSALQVVLVGGPGHGAAEGRRACELLRTVHDAARGVGARVWTVTAGGSTGPSGTDPVRPSRLALRRAAISTGVDDPQTWGGVVDLHGDDVAEVALADALREVDRQAAEHAYDRVAVRAGVTWVERVEEVEESPGRDAAPWEGRAVLIAPACAMADVVAEAVHLLGASSVQVVDQPTASSTTVRADDGATVIWLGSCREMWASAPSVADDATVPDVERLRALLRSYPEVDDVLVLAAVVSWWGGAGSAWTATDDALLEGEVVRLRRRGRRAAVIWTGPVEQEGRDCGLRPDAVARARATGLRPSDVAGLARALHRASEQGVGRDAVVVDGDWRQVASAYAAAVRWPFFELLDTRVASDDAPRWETAQEASSDVLDRVVRAVADVVGVDPGAVVPTVGFFDAGITSITALALRGRLEQDLRAELPATVVFDHPTPVALRDHLLTVLEGVPAATAGQGAETSPDVTPQPRHRVRGTHRRRPGPPPSTGNAVAVMDDIERIVEELSTRPSRRRSGR